MSADDLVSRLDGVRRTGEGRWIARCPAHDDRHASMSVRELDDGRVLMHCFAGCDVEEVLAALGLEFDALFPERPMEYATRERRPFPAADVLRCVAFEALVVAAGGAALLSGQPFSEADRARLMLGVGRIQEAIAAAGVDHG